MPKLISWAYNKSNDNDKNNRSNYGLYFATVLVVHNY